MHSTSHPAFRRTAFFPHRPLSHRPHCHALCYTGDPCRSAKQRCDRGRPCSTCVKKKTPEKCKGSSTDGRRKLAKKRNQNENEELRDEGKSSLLPVTAVLASETDASDAVVDRLQKLVNVLVAARLDSVDSPFASSPSRPSIHPIPHVPETVSSNSDEEDLSERLFNLSISSFSTASPSNSVSTQHVQLIDDVSPQIVQYSTLRLILHGLLGRR